MALIETESLILKCYSLAEADKIVVLFTEDHGVVRAVAKGAKRLKSKFGSGLEPFSIVRITYFEKEGVELVSVQNIELLRSYFAAASDPEFLIKFTYLADLIVALSPPHDPNETLYRMVKACLETAEVDNARLLAIGVYFEIWLLRLTGLLPEWRRCSVCEREFLDGEITDLSANFQLLCTNCRRASSGRTIDQSHRTIYTAVQRLSPEKFTLAHGNERTHLAELSVVLKRIISQAIGREVSTEQAFSIYNSR
ncbi:MAG TPA: DNA repair protein RecO [Pyrinomonadaceae bacterium]|nr:DNA repair protein RecO [Chloracidobacterium sp.]MBL0239369.1 DNA repair protein RecO [Chloracidobacterium sp.]MBP9936429.1 DNA repair protein RecO [Pyrinomonadaceae bacterium]HQY67884.1 DNA repair protein RecO [Pyrinomonadaceae bacterium]